METIVKLTELANKLQDKGLISLASDVDGATKVFIKIAKELGGQGYWIQNERCWQGCYRSKRSSKTKTPVQEIWFECQAEYEKAINGDPDDWNKYAGGQSTMLKMAENAKFRNEVKSMIDSGDDIGTAVFTTISNNLANIQAQVIDSSETLAKVSDKLADKNFNLSIEAAELAGDMVKEAWGIGGLGNVVNPLLNKMRGVGPQGNVNLTTISTLLNQLEGTLNNFIKQKNDFLAVVNKSQGIADNLKQLYKKNTRPLTQDSIKEMKDQTALAIKSMQKQPVNPNTAPANPRADKPQMQQQQSGQGAANPNSANTARQMFTSRKWTPEQLKELYQVFVSNSQAA